MLYSEIAIKGVGDLEGMKINRENLNKIRYADNTTLIADVKRKLKDIVDKIVTESERFGLSFNVIKHSAWYYEGERDEGEWAIDRTSITV